MAQQGRIPIPWSLRWQRFRQSALPVLTFAACVVCTAWLWERRGAAPGILGEVEVIRADVVASGDGVLLPLPQGPWNLYDRVEENQIIARIDDRLVRAELASNQETLKQLRDEMAATAEEVSLEEAERQHDHQREAVRLAWELQQRRLDLLDRMSLIEASKVEHRRLTMQLELYQPLMEKNAISRIEFENIRLERDRIQREIEKNEQALSEARQQLDLATKRVESFPDRVPAEIDRIIAPLRSAIAAQEGVIRQLQVQIELLEVRAPFSGTIAAIYQWPGQMIRAGDPIVTVAADQGRYVVGYVRDDYRFKPEVGMPIEIVTRHSKPKIYTSHVDRVGPQVELVPQHQLRNATYPEWGLPVRIAMPPTAQLRPGELVDLRFAHQ